MWLAHLGPTKVAILQQCKVFTGKAWVFRVSEISMMLKIRKDKTKIFTEYQVSLSLPYHQFMASSSEYAGVIDPDDLHVTQNREVDWWLDRINQMNLAKTLKHSQTLCSNVVIFPIASTIIHHYIQQFAYHQNPSLSPDSTSSTNFTVLHLFFAMSSFQDKAQGHIAQLDKEVSAQFHS